MHGVLSVQTVGASEQHLSHLNGVLEPMRLTLQTQDYLGGSSPTYADFAAAGAFAVCMNAPVLHSCNTSCLHCMSQNRITFDCIVSSKLS